MEIFHALSKVVHDPGDEARARQATPRGRSLGTFSISSSLALFSSLVRTQTPPSHEEKGLVDIERFLGSACCRMKSCDFWRSSAAR